MLYEAFFSFLLIPAHLSADPWAIHNLSMVLHHTCTCCLIIITNTKWSEFWDNGELNCKVLLCLIVIYLEFFISGHLLTCFSSYYWHYQGKLDVDCIWEWKGMRHFYQYLGQLYFQEADNWTVLSSDVDKVFESGDVKAVSLKKNYSTVMLQMYM